MPQHAIPRLLVACERSGRVRDAFRKHGIHALSCDIEPSLTDSAFHLQKDVLKVLHDDWDAMIAFPPCTYLCSSGQHWNGRRLGRAALTEDASKFFLALANASIPIIAIENSIGIMSRRYRKPDQIIQPYQFGEDASKATCLWLQNLPLLMPTTRVQGRWVTGHTGKRIERWSNQTDGGQNRLGPSEDRGMLRGLTYPGIAEAMAEQWSPIIWKQHCEA